MVFRQETLKGLLVLVGLAALVITASCDRNKGGEGLKAPDAALSSAQSSPDIRPDPKLEASRNDSSFVFLLNYVVVDEMSRAGLVYSSLDEAGKDGWFLYRKPLANEIYKVERAGEGPVRITYGGPFRAYAVKEEFFRPELQKVSITREVIDFDKAEELRGSWIEPNLRGTTPEEKSWSKVDRYIYSGMDRDEWLAFCKASAYARQIRLAAWVFSLIHQRPPLDWPEIRDFLIANGFEVYDQNLPDPSGNGKLTIGPESTNTIQLLIDHDSNRLVMRWRDLPPEARLSTFDQNNWEMENVYRLSLP